MNDGNGPTSTGDGHAPVHTDAARAFPRPVVRRPRWPVWLIWLVPLLALGVTAYYLYAIYLDRGPEITVRVTDAGDIRRKETPLVVHGVQVGLVSGVGLTDAGDAAVVRVRLHRNFAHIARTHTAFWIDRANAGGGILRGLDTIIVGPRLEARPGGGDPTTHFVALDRPPIARGDGLKVLLKTDRLPRMDVESPVYYRGVTVGAVQDIRLGSDGRTVNVTIYVHRPYVPLVRTNSRFWAVKGIDVGGGLFSGVRLQVDSLRAFIAGGIEFATPNDTGQTPAGDGDGWFDLHDEPKPEWLRWQTALPVDTTTDRADDAARGQRPLELR